MGNESERKMCSDEPTVVLQWVGNRLINERSPIWKCPFDGAINRHLPCIYPLALVFVAGTLSTHLRFDDRVFVPDGGGITCHLLPTHSLLFGQMWTNEKKADDSLMHFKISRES